MLSYIHECSGSGHVQWNQHALGQWNFYLTGVAALLVLLSSAMCSAVFRLLFTFPHCWQLVNTTECNYTASYVVCTIIEHCDDLTLMINLVPLLNRWGHVFKFYLPFWKLYIDRTCLLALLLLLRIILYISNKYTSYRRNFPRVFPFNHLQNHCFVKLSVITRTKAALVWHYTHNHLFLWLQ